MDTTVHSSGKVSATSPLSVVKAWVTAHWLSIAVFATVVVIALAGRLVTFDTYLPYHDRFDESNMYLLARHTRGLEIVPIVPEWLAGYPPLYIWMSIGWQQAYEALTTKLWLLPSDYLYQARAMSVVAGVLTALVVAIIGKQLAGCVAAFFAGLVWALAPILLENNSEAIPDPWTTLACAVSISMALEAYRKRSPGWSLASLIFAIAATYLKYPAFPVLIPWAVATLFLLVRQPRRMLGWLVAEAIIAAGSVYYLIVVYGALRLENREAESVRSSGLQLAFDIDRNWNNWQYAFIPTGMLLFFGVLAAGAVSYWVSRRRGWRLVPWQPVVVLAIYAVVSIMVTASFSNVALNKYRHVMPIVIVLLPLWGAAIAQTYWTLSRMLHVHTSRFALANGLLVVLLLLWAVPATVEVAAMAQRFSRIETRQVLWQWADVNVPMDGKILMHGDSELHFIWNRPYGGYDGTTPFDWWFNEQPWETPPANFQDADIAFWAMTDNDVNTLFRGDQDELRQFTDQLLHLKTVRPDAGSTGPTIEFYRILPPQHEAEADYGAEIRLIGYDLSAEQIAAGGSLMFRPYWRTLQPPTQNYSMFLHLVPQGEAQPVAQVDGAPTTPQRLTLSWTDPDETYVGRDTGLTIPPELMPGSYELRIGLYNFQTGERLTVQTGESYLAIPVEVVAAP